ncbi:MAG: bifunctional phosphoribosyl-AMP cyclohydrolase/phosphoribosyl-ATP diphosphatase HisIE [Luteibaculum sp.]
MQIFQRNLAEINFKWDPQGLIPAVVQHQKSGQVLMLGYMNREAIQKTLEGGLVTFFSRSKNRLWTKGESSGHTMRFKEAHVDCDLDTLLIYALPSGPVCHKGTPTCFEEDPGSELQFISSLEDIIKNRKEHPNEKSYTSSLFAKGINKVAQKVGEEAVEVVIEAKDNNEALFLNESADLLFHYLILLQAKGYTLTDVVNTLKARNH